jgi:hypothetical protein
LHKGISSLHDECYISFTKLFVRVIVFCLAKLGTVWTFYIEITFRMTITARKIMKLPISVSAITICNCKVLSTNVEGIIVRLVSYECVGVHLVGGWGDLMQGCG